jgi:hypothetical protein
MGVEFMPQAETGNSTIDAINLSDRLNDIAGRIDVVHLAIEGAAAELDTLAFKNFTADVCFHLVVRLLVFTVVVVVIGIWDTSQNHGRILDAVSSFGWYLLHQVGLA